MKETLNKNSAPEQQSWMVGGGQIGPLIQCAHKSPTDLDLSRVDTAETPAK